jgi:threonine dehydrogenase-like Zn-dependent dehydrogenase
VGTEAHAPGVMYAYDRFKQALMLESDRPLVLRQAIMACRNGGTVSVVGVYGGFIDRFRPPTAMRCSRRSRTIA